MLVGCPTRVLAGPFLSLFLPFFLSLYFFASSGVILFFHILLSRLCAKIELAAVDAKLSRCAPLFLPEFDDAAGVEN